MFKNELKKLLGNRLFLILAAILFLINGLYSIFYSVDLSAYESSYITQSEAKEDTIYTANFLMRRFQEDSYEYKRAEKELALYSNLSTDTTELQENYEFFYFFTEDALTGGLALALTLVGLLLITVMEQNNNVMALTYGTVNGRRRHATVKWHALLCILLGSYLILLLEKCIVSGIRYGIPSLLLPVQTIPGMQYVADSCTVIGYLAFSTLVTGLVLAATSATIWAIMQMAHRMWSLTVLVAVATWQIVAFLTVNEVSRLSGLKIYNLLTILDVNSWSKSGKYLNVFGMPVRSYVVYLVLLLIILCLGAGLGILAYRYQGGRSKAGLRLHLNWNRHTCLFLHEWKKSLLHAGGIWVVAILVIVAIGCYRPVTNQVAGQEEYCYITLLNEYLGPYDDSYYDEVEGMNDSMKQQLADVDEGLLEMNSQEVESLEIRQRATERVEDYFAYLDGISERENIYVMNNSGLSMLTGDTDEYNRTEALRLMLATALVVLFTALIYHYDLRHKEIVLIHTTVKGRNRYTVIKRSQQAIFAGGAWLAVILVTVIQVIRVFGTQNIGAAACSFMHLSGWTIPVWLVLLLKYLLLLAWLLLASYVAERMIRAIRNLYLSVAITEAMLILPILLYILLET